MFFCFILLYETQLRALCQHIFTFFSLRVLRNWGRARPQGRDTQGRGPLDTLCFGEHSPAYPSVFIPRVDRFAVASDKEAYHAVLSSSSKLHAGSTCAAHRQSAGSL